MSRTKVATISIEVYADIGVPIAVELHTQGAGKPPTKQTVPIRRTDERAAKHVEMELRPGIQAAIAEALVAALPHTRRRERPC